MTRHRVTVAIVVLLVASGCSGLPETESDTTTTLDGRSLDGSEVTVVHVIDGDTMDVRFENGTTIRVRLLGVDSPETHSDVSPEDWEGVPDSPAGRECLREWGDRASTFATEELDGRSVTLVIDTESDVRGGYGRLLAYLAYEDTTFNERLLETGHARLYDSVFSKRDEFAAIEQAAAANETGAWSCRTPTEYADGGGSAPIENAHLPMSLDTTMRI